MRKGGQIYLCTQFLNKSVPFSLVRNVDGAKTEVWLKWLGK